MLLLITESGQIRKIGFSTPMHLLNNVARGVTQSGIANNEPFTNIGLTGRNIVVGIADTGIDENSCFFNDSINGVIPRSDLTNLYYNLTYRKVVQYVTYSDSLGDVSSGHGSHVAGTVAGSCIDNSKSNYNGMAKDSKIAFFDIASTDGTLRFPAHMSELYKASYHAKATIQSNSWGGGYWYDTFSQETDEYLYYNDDMTIIYAGGNSGTSGYQTIMSPSLSKNVISVGATETGRSLQNINKIPYFSSVGPAPDNRFKPDILSPGYVIYSADSKNELISKYSCKVSTKFGTSMSAPNVAEIKSNAFDYNPLDIYNPTSAPTNLPSNIPTKLPTRKPTPKLIPSPRPTRRPSRKPTIRPSRFPTLYPTSEPTARPSFRPISFPSSHPTIKVNTAPTSKPNSPWQL
eukprot:gene21773-28175_t